jgi:uncharacterized protein (TIGR02145 family)
MMRKFLFAIGIVILCSCQKNSPPELDILSPADNSVFAQGEEITISISADDPDGTITEIRLSLDNIGLVSLLSFPYNYVLSTEDLEPGTHTIQALAIDDGGKQSTDELMFQVSEEGVVKNVSISGYVQMGPYLNGTAILISELDEELNQTGKNFTTQISNNAGGYNTPGIELESDFLEFRATGFYYDEILGETSSTQLTLDALANAQDSMTVNINVLTHLEKSRIKYLMGTGISFSESKQKAQEEVLAIFHIEKEDISPSVFLDISKADEDNAILLAISLILQSGRSVGALSELLANISSDFREDGTLESESIKASLFNQAHLIDTVDVKTKLESRYNSLEVNANISNFGKYIAAYIEEQNPFKLEASISDVSCFGYSDGAIDITVTGGTPPYSFEWLPGGQTGEDLTNLPIGLYELGIMDANGYCISKFFQINEPEALSVFVMSVTDELNGVRGAIDISVQGGTAPYAFEWSNGEGTEDISNLSCETYTVAVTDSNLCSSSLSVSVKGSFIDSRDNKEYIVAPIGNQIWMGENLAYLPSVNPPGDGSISDPYYYVYDYSWEVVEDAKMTSNYQEYGVLYNWPAAKLSCPSGWHLPSDAEWKQMGMYLGMSKEEADKRLGAENEVGGLLKEEGYEHWNSPNTGASNISGFSALGTGYRAYENPKFLTIRSYSCLWTSTSYNDHLAWCRLLFFDMSKLSRDWQNYALGAAVRCVRDD